jgi:hypothetical protein
MKHYALLFYPTRELTPEEQDRRRVEIANWVKQVQEMGLTLDPRVLGESSAVLPEATSRNGAGPRLTNIVFFDAPSQDEAVNVARIHPGLHYGVIVDVREWSVPQPAAAATTR